MASIGGTGCFRTTMSSSMSFDAVVPARSSRRFSTATGPRSSRARPYRDLAQSVLCCRFGRQRLERVWFGGSINRSIRSSGQSKFYAWPRKPARATSLAHHSSNPGLSGWRRPSKPATLPPALWYQQALERSSSPAISPEIRQFGSRPVWKRNGTPLHSARRAATGSTASVLRATKPPKSIFGASELPGFRVKLHVLAGRDALP